MTTIDGASKVEVRFEPPAIQTIQAAPTSVVAALGLTVRGPVATPTLVTSFEEFVTIFGGFRQGLELPVAIQGFFRNGGQQIYVCRTAHYTDQLDASTLTAEQAEGIITAPDPSDPALSVDALRVFGKTPGTYANQVVVEIRDASSGQASEFDLVVEEDGEITALYTNLSLDTNAPRYALNIVNVDSLIALEDLASGAATLTRDRFTLSGGDDGLTGIEDNDFIGSPVSEVGLYAIDKVVRSIALVIAPDRATAPFHQALIEWCENHHKGQLFAILDPPESLNTEGIIRYVETEARLLDLSESGAIYWPRVKISNPSRAVYSSSALITVAPSGHVAGVYARTDGSQDGGVYRSPAGIDQNIGTLYGVVDFQSDEVLDVKKRDLIYPKRINPLTTGPGMPLHIDGSRTLSSTGNYPHINTKRGVIFIARSIQDGLQWARHRNNNARLRARVRRTLTSFLTTQTALGAFASFVPDEAFSVEIPDNLNTHQAQLRGELHVRVGLAMVRPNEFIIITITQQTAEAAVAN